MKTKTFTFYTDPGHGWLKVPRNLLNELGIASSISSYSYENGTFVYLEEDCDAPRLLDALKAKGIEVTIVTKNSNRSSRIRCYSPYQYFDIEKYKAENNIRY